MIDDYFKNAVEVALEELPQDLKERLDNVDLFIEDYPNPYQMRKIGKRGGFLLGLYEGVPQTRRGRYGIGATVPDRITIFKGPLMRVSNSKENLVENIKSTVWHEIAHHFGMGEHEVRKAEEVRRKKRGKR